MANSTLYPLLGESTMITEELQLQIRDSFWPKANLTLQQYAAYFQHVQRTIRNLSWPWADLALQRDYLATKTYADLFLVVETLNDSLMDSRSTVIDKLLTKFPGATRPQIIGSVQLVIRLWLTLYLTSNDGSVDPQESSLTTVDWSRKSSLHHSIRNTFPQSRRYQYLPNAITGRLDTRFSVVYMRKVCQIKVAWTANLKDHLKFDQTTRALHVYPHKTCLISHLQTRIFPVELLMETLRTLELLFPFGDESTTKWLEEEGQPFYRISAYNSPRATDLSEFKYWRRQLVELYLIFQQPPTTVKQMWNDRRNPMQWYTFWLAVFIALMTMVFGVISSYTGFKQVELAQQLSKQASPNAMSTGSVGL